MMVSNSAKKKKGFTTCAVNCKCRHKSPKTGLKQVVLNAEHNNTCTRSRLNVNYGCGVVRHISSSVLAIASQSLGDMLVTMRLCTTHEAFVLVLE